MKIIKQGKTKEELKVILNATKRFECKTCGCVFEADKGEYVEEEYGTTYCACPNCGKNAFEVKMREIEKKAEDKPKTCYDVGCKYHIGVDRCSLAFPTGTSFEKMLTCPYRMSKPLPNIELFSELFGEKTK